jgi:hypothetical protein
MSLPRFSSYPSTKFSVRYLEPISLHAAAESTANVANATATFSVCEPEVGVGSELNDEA